MAEESALLPPEAPLDALDVERAFAAVSHALLGTSEGPAEVGRFRIEQRVGSGGMGVVYAAVDPELDRRVAIKVLHPDIGGSRQDRLLAEARALARLNHPNIVSVHEVGTADGRVFIAMELVEGIPMSTWLTTPRPWREVAQVALDAGRGLAAAHEAGIVHRDFKPANVMLRPDGSAVVLDFGLARLRESNLVTVPTDVAGNVHGDTQASALAGTPAYMAPEQHLGRAATPLSDQFSFCVSIYEAAYGQRPFDAATRIGLLQAIDDGRFRPRPKRRAVPTWLRRSLERGLQTAPADRWASMDELLARVERGLVPAWKRALVPGAVLGSGALVAAAVMKDDAPSCAALADRIHETWNPTVAQQTRRALGAFDHPAAETMPERVASQLDAYAAGWRDRFLSTCALEREADDADARAELACLEGQRRWLSTALGLLESPSTEVLVDATHVVPDVSSLEECAGAEDASPSAPSNAPGRAEFERMLQEARVLMEVSAWGESEARLDAADALGDLGLGARSLRMRGRLAIARGDREAGRAALEQAILEAERRGDTVGRLAAMRALASEDIASGNREQAARTLAQVEAAHERFSRHPWTWEADLLRMRADLENGGGHTEAALDAARRHLGLVESKAPEDHDRLLRARLQLVRIRLTARDAEGLQEELEAIIAEARAHLGPVHEIIAIAQSNLGNLFYARGEIEAAIEMTQASIDVRRQLGSDEAALLAPLNNLASMKATLGDDEAAEAIFQHIIDFAKAHRPTYDKRMVKALYNLSGIHERRDDTSRSADILREVVDLSRDVYGKDAPETVAAMLELARRLLGSANYSGAIDQLERAREIEVTTRGDRTEVCARILNDFANVYHVWGYPERSREYAEQAYAALDSEHADMVLRIEVSVILVTALLQSSDPKDRLRADTILRKVEPLAENPRIVETLRERMKLQRAALSR